MRKLINQLRAMMCGVAIAYNTEQRLVATAANAKTIDGEDADGWFQIAPYGTTRFHDGKQWLEQCFERPDADKMVVAFNSFVGKVARIGTGLPIYEGHPDVDPVVYSTARRLGKLVEIDAREDGLWGKPAWNSLGQENVAEGFWNYPSPVWYYPKTKGGKKSFHPDELKSVGLTNAPNIRDVQPIAANAENPEEETDMKLTPAIMAILGLTEEGREYSAEEIGGAIEALSKKATDAETLAANTKTEKDAEAAKVTAAESAKATAEQEKAEANKVAANAILDAGVIAGKMTKAEADALRDKGDVAIAANALSTATAKPVLPAGTIDIGARRVAINSAVQRDAVITEAVNDRMTTKGEAYDVAWNAVKKDPAFAPVFEAMKQPGQKAEN